MYGIVHDNEISLLELSQNKNKYINYFIKPKIGCLFEKSQDRRKS